LAKILAVGIATLDIINTVAEYPNEDDEVRAITHRRSRGGNATNTLAILSQLHHHCYWAGTLVNEADSKFVLEDLDKFQIDYSLVDFLAGGKIPTSYITINQKNASRSIIHYRELAEYSFEQFKKIQLEQFDWIHFEGRNINQVEKMLDYCAKTQPHVPISLEIEKKRPDIENLFPYADVLLFSKQYAQSIGAKTAELFLQQLPKSIQDKTISCTWGKEGAALLVQGKVYKSPAFLQKQNINTLAAGDTFNAAIIDNLLTKNEPQETLTKACQLAAKKCASEQLDFITSKQASI